MHSPETGREQAFLFDLDGTLVDSVYQHVLASVTRPLRFSAGRGLPVALPLRKAQKWEARA